MAKFGYQVPTTWQQYQALGEQVAKQHPGYVLGAVGDVNLYYDSFCGAAALPLGIVVNGARSEDRHG